MGDLLHPDPLQFLLINVEGQKKFWLWLLLKSEHSSVWHWKTKCLSWWLSVSLCSNFSQYNFYLESRNGESLCNEVLVLQFCIKSLRSLLVPSCTLPVLAGLPIMHRWWKLGCANYRILNEAIFWLSNIASKEDGLRLCWNSFAVSVLNSQAHI